MCLMRQFRILFRIVEFSFSQGTKVNQYINHHEFFVYIFDAVPMFFALLLMNIVCFASFHHKPQYRIFLLHL